MAYKGYSLDELITLIADTFDTTVAPQKIWRNDNNKFYLSFKAIAAGLQRINDSMAVMSQKFDPRYCSDKDLVSVGRLVGTQMKMGANTQIRITATNNDVRYPQVLPKGTYTYTDTGGNVFSATVPATTVVPLGSFVFAALSIEKGSFPVSSITNANVQYTGEEVENDNFTFGILDNATTLGYDDENVLSYRNRLLTDTGRVDAINALELAIGNLPGIFACNIIFNGSVDPVSYDSIILAPFQLLICITGIADSSLAKTVAGGTVYLTKMVNENDFVNYEDSHFVGGVYPVYFMYHKRKQYSVHITYEYDEQITSDLNAEQRLTSVVNQFKNTVVFRQFFTEDIIYDTIRKEALSGIKILSVSFTVDGIPVPYVSATKTELLDMASVSFLGVKK